ncbi:hypothetical protein HII36_23075 [Nonomuraea sp. NN258]|uniref:hypothetical protein n=1 Tax=Nonomuraea antri TaxID=2730852 RepID=UPI001567D9D0|nr:hypothetical protein [Nonomuraea antri]NRQ34692.1 hypothetical protein [Nonomuraea antri]
MNIVGHIYFGIVTRDGARYWAKVELPGRPDLVVRADSEPELVGAVDHELAAVLGVAPEELDVHLFGHDGTGAAPVYAGAAVFDGDRWLTQFPAQEDLPVALDVPPSPSYESAAERVRSALAGAVGRPADGLDIEFFEITPRRFADRGESAAG